MTLAELQALFWRAIRWPTGIDDFLREADDATRAAFEAAFAETAAFDRRARMEVYAEAYFWRLHDVLRDHFGLLARLLGPDRFRNLATDYVWQCPSQDPDIRRFGARLPAFVAAHAEGLRVPGLAGVAAIEWAMVRALDVPQPDAPLRRAELLARPPEAWPSLRLASMPSVAIERSELPFLAMWRAFDADAITLPLPPPGVARAVLVWREQLAVMVRELDDDEADALSRLRRGCAFDELCEGRSPEQVVAWLQRWIDDALVRHDAGVERPAPR